jgi:hypothetical protein
LLFEGSSRDVLVDTHGHPTLIQQSLSRRIQKKVDDYAAYIKENQVDLTCLLKRHFSC